MHFLSDIVQYSYSPEELKMCLRAADLWDYKISKKEVEEKVEEYSNSFLSSNCAITKIKVIKLGENKIYCPENVKDALCLRRTNHILKKALRLPLLNRDDEVKQLLQILSGETKCSVFRTDIQSYFESLPFSAIILKLREDGLRNNSALAHLKNLNSFLIENYSYSGLPRGLALSSTLAEYALQNFDRNISNSPSAIYYTRYVDDICIVHFDDGNRIYSLVEKELPFNLKLNKSKTQKLGLPSKQTLEFLGYNITLNQPQIVSIAESKICKAKKRIVLSIKEFLRDANFKLLLRRLRFLSCSIRMKKLGRKVPVCTGYRHVYRLCHQEAIIAQLRNLDKFLHGIINSKRFSLSHSLRSLTTPEQKNQLRTLSFEKNYANNLTFKAKPHEISQIKRAWKYG